MGGDITPDLSISQSVGGCHQEHTALHK